MEKVNQSDVLDRYAEYSADYVGHENTINGLADKIHRNAVVHGWWDTVDGQKFPARVMMVVTELSEAVDEYRNQRGNFYFTKETRTGEQVYCQNPREWIGDEIHGTAVELVDALIRILDILSAMPCVDIDRLILMKMSYNAERSKKHDGKLC